MSSSCFLFCSLFVYSNVVLLILLVPVYVVHSLFCVLSFCIGRGVFSIYLPPLCRFSSVCIALRENTLLTVRCILVVTNNNSWQK